MRRRDFLLAVPAVAVLAKAVPIARSRPLPVRISLVASVRAPHHSPTIKITGTDGLGRVTTFSGPLPTGRQRIDLDGWKTVTRWEVVQFAPGDLTRVTLDSLSRVMLESVPKGA